jgi:GNAT superfamily N-acetyltransferase
MPELTSLLPGALYDERVLGDERLRFWTGRVDGKAVGVAAAFVAAGINDVVFVATLPEARGRGYGAALTWQAAQAEPELPAMLLSSDLGRPVYDQMGFLPLFRFTLWARERPGRA